MKRALGCSFLSVALIAGAIAFGAWSLLSYRVLLRERIKVEARWSRIENVYQRRWSLASHLAESSESSLRDRETARALADACDRLSEIILSPAILGDPARLRELQRLHTVQSSAISEVLRRLEQGAAIDGSVRSLERQLAETDRTLATELEGFNRRVHDYNALIDRFPLSGFARVYGFRSMPVLGTPTLRAPRAPTADGEPPGG